MDAVVALGLRHDEGVEELSVRARDGVVLRIVDPHAMQSGRQ